MSKRSYHQFCPLAYSLDIVGERWTLLIVRDLMMGPRRYTDLQRGLPGIGTNLLSKRLKALEEAGIIYQHRLPPPASSTVYELTDNGRGLIPALTAFAEWGMQFIKIPPPNDDYVGVIPAIGALHKLFDPVAAEGVQLVGEIHAEAECIAVMIDGGKLQAQFGSADEPDFVLQTEFHWLLRLLGQPAQISTALAEEHLILEDGSAEELESFASCFMLHQDPD